MADDDWVDVLAGCALAVKASDEVANVVWAAVLEVTSLVLETTFVEDEVAAELDVVDASELVESVASAVDPLLLSTAVVDSTEEEVTSADVALVASETMLDVVAAASVLMAELSTVALALLTTTELVTAAELVAADCATEVAATSSLLETIEVLDSGARDVS